MLDELDKDKYDIRILMLEEYGGFLNSIPDNINVKYVEKFSAIKQILNSPPIEVTKGLIKSGNLIRGINIDLIHLLSKMLGKRSVYFKYVLKGYKELSEKYDLAVAYAGPMDFITYFVLNKIRAKKKLQWVHFDITKIGTNFKFIDKFYSKFDKVLMVSNEWKKIIEQVLSLKKNTEAFFNVVSEEKIRELSNKEIVFKDNFDGTRILTVGRLSKEK